MRGGWAGPASPWSLCGFVTGLLAALLGSTLPAASAGAEAPDLQLKPDGAPQGPAAFPVAVWLQDPKLAPRYRAAGMNLYVGLWKGPTEDQLRELREVGMPVVCAQNEVGLAHRDDPIIVGWMHGDEPDNAQPKPGGKGWGPPVPPERIVADYRRIKKNDPTRPVLLNLGQGVAWPEWHGRGVRTGRQEDYPLYARGADIVSFDIYPAAHPDPRVRGELTYVAKGVRNLVAWTRGAKPVWNCLECTRIKADGKATPAEVRAEAWMALVAGSRGFIWFVHSWEPRFQAHALLDDKPMLEAVTRINREVRALAPVLAGPEARDAVRVTAPGAAPGAVSWTARRHGGALYVFVVGMTDAETDVELELRGPLGRSGFAHVLGAGRRLPIRAGRGRDRLGPWGVGLYRVGLAGD